MKVLEVVAGRVQYAVVLGKSGEHAVDDLPLSQRLAARFPAREILAVEEGDEAVGTGVVLDRHLGGHEGKAIEPGGVAAVAPDERPARGPRRETIGHPA